MCGNKVLTTLSWWTQQRLTETSAGGGIYGSIFSSSIFQQRSNGMTWSLHTNRGRAAKKGEFLSVVQINTPWKFRVLHLIVLCVRPSNDSRSYISPSNFRWEHFLFFFFQWKLNKKGWEWPGGWVRRVPPDVSGGGGGQAGEQKEFLIGSICDANSLAEKV